MKSESRACRARGLIAIRNLEPQLRKCAQSKLVTLVRTRTILGSGLQGHRLRRALGVLTEVLFAKRTPMRHTQTPPEFALHAASKWLASVMRFLQTNFTHGLSLSATRIRRLRRVGLTVHGRMNEIATESLGSCMFRNRSRKGRRVPNQLTRAQWTNSKELPPKHTESEYLESNTYNMRGTSSLALQIVHRNSTCKGVPTRKLGGAGV